MTRTSKDIKSRAGVYANVAFDAAKNASGMDGVVQLRNDLTQVLQIIASNVELKDALSSDAFEASQKQKLVDELTQHTSEVVTSIINAMSQNCDIDMLRLCMRIVESRIEEEFSVCIVDVTTVVELDDNLRTLIQDKVKTDLGMDAILHESIDKSIVGGIIMSVNGKCIDASMRSQLNHARSVLKAS